jgi:hypothetical protein
MVASFWLATAGDGSVTCLDTSGNMATLGERDLVAAGTRLAGSAGIVTQGLIGDGDPY